MFDQRRNHFLYGWGVQIQVRDPRSKSGGGYWWPDKKLVDLFTAQEEAAIHEVAHAWWHPRRLEGRNAAEMIVATVKLAEEPDARYERARTIANYYVYGIQGQKDDSSPTELGNGRGHSLELLLRSRGDDDVGAGLRERGRDSGAEATTGPRHDRDAILQSERAGGIN